MSFALAIILLIPLAACGAVPLGVVYGLEAAGAAAYLAKEVIGIDIALTQDTIGKVPIVKAVP